MTGVKQTSSGRKLAILIATALAALAAATGSTAKPLASGPTFTARSCSSGYKHAVIGGQEKCLRAGEFCAHRYDSQYRRYGYRCIRFYSNVGQYRLTHA
jgi:hypothetical protein